MSCNYPSFLLTRVTLHWRHNGLDSVSHHQPRDCLLKRLFRRRSKKTSKLRVTGLCVGNSPGPVNSPHDGPVTRKMFPFDDVIKIRTKIMANCYQFKSSFWGFNPSKYPRIFLRLGLSNVCAFEDRAPVNFIFNSLWPSDALWRHRSGSTMAQVMACFQTASNHYLNQCWLVINDFCGIHTRTFTRGNSHDIIPQDEFENHIFLKLLPHLSGANEFQVLYRNATTGQNTGIVTPAMATRWQAQSLCFWAQSLSFLLSITAEYCDRWYFGVSWLDLTFVYPTLLLMCSLVW